ncbi:hypothetical protein [Gordonia polyisoprenivorans]|uniref:hypothetical protein n=1 Tax=Gordonia polyisoprenivorans TaxID=84595 RepID=UPI001AD77A29|nr:hypothetical protein [Gordonia polyisoprenivorans]QTI70992.1 hypothetical protein J6U32_10965 [Gordonia polyisoprenivorans]
MTGGAGRGARHRPDLAAEGAASGRMGRTEAKLAAVAHEIRALGGVAVVIDGDVTVADDVGRTVTEAVAGPGRTRHPGQQRADPGARLAAVDRRRDLRRGLGVWPVRDVSDDAGRTAASPGR